MKTTNTKVSTLKQPKPKISPSTQVTQSTKGKGSTTSAIKPTNLNNLITTGKKIFDTAVDVESTISKIATNPFDVKNYLDIPRVAMETVTAIDDASKLISTVDLKKNAPKATVINTTNVPTAFGNQVSNSDFTVGSTSYKGAGGSLTVTSVKQSIIVDTVYFPTVSAGDITAHDTKFLYAFGTFGTRVDNIAEAFDKFRIASATVSYTSQSATSTTGSVHLIYRDKPLTMFNPSGISIQDASQFKHTYTNAWGNCVLNIPIHPGWLYTGSLATSGDNKFFAQGVVGIGTSGQLLGAHPDALGYVQFDLVLEFTSPKAPDIPFTLIPSPQISKAFSMANASLIGQIDSSTCASILNNISTLLRVTYDSGKLLDDEGTKSSMTDICLAGGAGDSSQVINSNITNNTATLFIKLLKDCMMENVRHTTTREDVLSSYRIIIDCLFNWFVIGPRYYLWLHQQVKHSYTRLRGIKFEFDCMMDQEIGLVTFLRLAALEASELFIKPEHFNLDIDDLKYLEIEENHFKLPKLNVVKPFKEGNGKY
jgi:hypothetical protein